MGILKSLNQALSLFTTKSENIKTGTGAAITHHRLETMEGAFKSIEDYNGNVLMIVNVASKCGLATQYGQLVTLHDEYKNRNFAVIGLPANNFLNQEPGSDEDIRNFCSTKYGVNFEVFSKISVAEPDQHPLYKTLTSKEENGELGGPIEWNFTKFIVDQQGRVIARINPKIEPDDPGVIEIIENALSKS